MFFFFKQKTAYELRISDWSSDVCSSYLVEPIVVYSHIYGEFRSGATLVMPSRSLGMEYRAMTYQATSQFSIIGLEDETYVEITPTAETETGRVAHVQFPLTLQRSEDNTPDIQSQMRHPHDVLC